MVCNLKVLQNKLDSLATEPSCFYAHIGTSMIPTLCRQDLLEIEPYGNRITQVGDIIVFERSGDGQAVVHRIIDLTPSGICTRGDGNASADRYLVQPEDITGRVIAAWRGNQRRKIPGGKVASIRVNLSCHRQRLNRLICGLALSTLYDVRSLWCHPSPIANPLATPHSDFSNRRPPAITSFSGPALDRSL